ncbi:MAG: hypothetical protein JRI96_07570 [Deltaproteobacteria bacterium]|nr:hypothetical protein [Deltaproteobacteria bacterium]
MRWWLALDGGEKLPPAALCSLGGRLFEPHCVSAQVIFAVESQGKFLVKKVGLPAV